MHFLLSSSPCLIPAMSDLPEGWSIGVIEERVGPLGKVWITHLEIPTGKQIPSSLDTSKGKFDRLMDRFFILHSKDAVAFAALFDILGASYEDVIDAYINLGNIRNLIALAMKYFPRRERSVPLRILDFGCGTGLSVRIAEEPAFAGLLEIIGTDSSPVMRAIAQRRGMVVVSFEELSATLAGAFDLSIASFVMHGGVRAADAELLGRSLVKKGIFAANLHHGTPEDIRRLEVQFISAGLHLVHVEGNGESEINPVLIFQRLEGE